MTDFSNTKNCFAENTVSGIASTHEMRKCAGEGQCIPTQEDSLVDRPLGIRMIETEDNSFDVVLLSNKILSSLIRHPGFDESPKRSSDTMKECVNNLYGNTKLAISILQKILQIIGVSE